MKHIDRCDRQDETTNSDSRNRSCGRREGFAATFLDDTASTLGLMGSWISGTYRAIPFRMIFAITLATIYLVSPIDLVPDTIPLAGWIDDFLVVAFILRCGRHDILRYRRWRTRREEED